MRWAHRLLSVNCTRIRTSRTGVGRAEALSVSAIYASEAPEPAMPGTLVSLARNRALPAASDGPASSLPLESLRFQSRTPGKSRLLVCLRSFSSGFARMSEQRNCRRRPVSTCRAFLDVHTEFPSPGPQRIPDLGAARSAFAPATIANLGPGFDFVGAALEGQGNVVTATFVDDINDENDGVTLKTDQLDQAHDASRSRSPAVSLRIPSPGPAAARAARLRSGSLFPLRYPD